MEDQRARLLTLLQRAADAASPREPVAIIGLAGRYPLADSREEFWENLRTGRDCIREVPAERWDADVHYDAEGRGRSYTKWAGFLDGVDVFDPLFFQIAPEQAEVMDPQERLFLQTAWATFEDAGYLPAAVARDCRVGVYVGAMNHDYEWMAGRADALGVVTQARSPHWSIANRVSFALDLRGPSVAVDTACSASLTAVHLACQSLRAGECDVALAGGVNLILDPSHLRSLSTHGMVSRGSRCRAFGAGADGFVDGEGVGAVLLKPLRRAESDGDRIEAVILGSALNSGGRTSGYTVPSAAAQAEVIRAALREAQIDPASLSYLEAHGTGTALGDPLEIRGLVEALGAPDDAVGQAADRCAIGSLKSVIGHLESAAGIAALTKVVLQMRHRLLTPSLHADELNPHIDFSRAPVELIREARPWPRPERIVEGRTVELPRRAGISSFGGGGANAHLVLQEYLPADPPIGSAQPSGPELVILSARTAGQLVDAARRLAERLTGHGDPADDGPSETAGRQEERLRSEAAAVLGLAPSEIDTHLDLASCGFGVADLVTFADRLRPELGVEAAETVLAGRPLAEVAARVRVDPAPAACLRLADVAHTLRVGRTAMTHRLALVVDDVAKAGQRLASWVERGADAEDSTGVLTGVADRRSGEVSTSERSRAELAWAHGDLLTAARLWVEGVDIDWGTSPGAWRVSLPTYPFGGRRYWIPEPPAVAQGMAPEGSAVPTLTDSAPTAALRCYRPVWCPVETAASDAEPQPARRLNVLVLAPAGAERLARAIAERHAADTVRMLGVDEPSGDAAETPSPRDNAEAFGWNLDRVYHLGGIRQGAGGERAADAFACGLASLLRLVRGHAPGGAAAGHPLQVRVVTADVIDLDSGGSGDPFAAALHGIVQVAPNEVSGLRAVSVDISSSELEAPEAVRTLAAAVVDEPCGPAGRVVVLRAGRRYERRLAEVELAAPRPVFRDHGVYLLVGGAGGIGQALSLRLARRHQARMVWLTREQLSENAARTVEEIRAAGGELVHVRGDVADADAVGRAVRECQDRFGTLHGVVHAAMAFDNRMLAATDDQAVRDLLAAKTVGVHWLAEAVRGIALDFMALFSSVGSFAGTAGNAAYTAASAVEDALGRHLRQDLGLPVTVVNWGYWGAVGSGARPGLSELFSTLGIEPIGLTDGLDAVDRVLGNALAQVVVLRANAQAETVLGVTRTRRVSAPEASPAKGHADPGQLRHCATPAVGGVLAAHDRLARLAVPMLLQCYRSMGAFTHAGERHRVAELRRALGISERFARLHQALIRILAHEGLVVLHGDYVESVHQVAGANMIDPAAAEAELDAIARDHPDVEPTVTITRLLLRSYPAILRGQVNTTEVMFPGSSMRLVQNFYRGNALTDSFNDLLRDALARLVEGWANASDSEAADSSFHVVELGAGTGATTEVLLPELAGYSPKVTYDITDVSSRFLEHATDRFAASYPFARFRLLDLEREPQDQGFGLGEADVVVATNVLHATSDLRQTLQRAKRLLRPGGWLLLNELTAVREIVTICGGVLEGWWRFDDALRIPDCPLATRATWRGLLEEAGFERVSVVDGTWEGRDLGQSVILGRNDGVGIGGAATAPAGTGLVAAPSESQLPAQSASDPEPAVPVPYDEVAAIIGAALKLDEPLDHDRTFAEYGLDSLNGIKVAAALEERFGVRTRLTTLFENPTVRQLAARLATDVRVESEPDRTLPASAAASGPALPRAKSAAPTRHPLTPGQRALWAVEQLAPGNQAYNVPLALWLSPEVDVVALRAALRAVVAAHEALRSRFVQSQDGPVVEVVDECDVPLRHTLLDGGDDLLRERMRAEVRRPFDLGRAPLLRAEVFSADDGRRALLVTFHHLVVDGVSLALFLDAVHQAYLDAVAGRPPTIQAPARRYQDFVAWQRELLSGPQGEQLRAFWLDRMADAPAPTQLPLDHPRPLVPSFSGASHDERIAGDVAEAVRTLAAQEQASSFTVYLAAFLAVIHRYSRERTILVGAPAAGRPSSGSFDDVIGYFMNMVPLLHEVRPTEGFKDLVRRLHGTVLDALEHNAYPLVTLIEERVRQDRIRPAELFRLAFYFQNWLPKDASAPRVALGPIPGVHQEGEFDLTLEVVEETDGARLCVKYAPNLFDPDTIERLATHYATLLAAALADPDRPVARLDLLTPAERASALRHSRRQYPRDRTVWDLVHERIGSDPSALAVVDPQTQLSYAELGARVEAGSAGLSFLGVGVGHTVGVLLPRSVDLPVALLAIMRCGAAYVPLDPTHPVERIAYMASNSGMRLLVVGPDADDHDPRIAAIRASGVRVIRWGTADLPDRDSSAGPSIDPEDLAYVIYTSGSTGRPKGVEVPHRGLTNLLTSMAREPGCVPGDRLLALTTVSFDIAGLELFLPLVCGATVEIVPESVAGDGFRLRRELAAGRATIVQATPATWRMVLAAGWEGDPSLRVLCGGEALDPDTAAALLARAGEVWNLYGPTETTIWASACRLSPGRQVSIGGPIANTRLLVLDEAMQPVPTGVLGELYVGGDGLARGYRGMPELTAARFVPDPFESGRLYRTGDQVRALPDGELEFVNRVDEQVKIRGFRVELGEIEATLRGQPGVRSAVVVARRRGPATDGLLACVTLDPEAVSPQPDELRRWLPDYMVPDAVVPLRAYPLTLNGKVDRASLASLTIEELRRVWGAPDTAELAGVPTTSADSGSPNDASIERGRRGRLVGDLVAAIAEVAQLDPAEVRLQTPLGELGLNSITFTSLSGRLSQLFGIELAPTTFYRHGTVVSVARFLLDQYAPAIEATYGMSAADLSVGLSPNPARVERGDTPAAARDVAVIGAAARLPGSADLDEFWTHLLAGDDLVTDIPAQRWDWRQFDGSEGRPASRSHWGGFAPDVDCFDAAFFGISPREAELMDPQQRLVLEAVWTALEHAGYRPSDLAGKRVGVFLAVTNSDYLEVQRDAGRAPEPHTLTGAALSIVPNRVSYLLDLRGPSVAVDTACSGSLTAVHEAVTALHTGSCELAVAGGISLILSPWVYLALSQSEMLSPDGRCKAFDSRADGYVRGEGVGVVVLKPREAAERDGDAVLGLIKGTAVNHSGRTTSLTAPNPDAQAAVVLAAHRGAGTDPFTLGYLETHGTGTALGDPIEIEGLRSAVETLLAERGGPAGRTAPIGIGSVKTNIGHLEAAAGIAGLLKVLLSLRDQVVPASLHFREANPRLPLDESPFRVVDRVTPWPAPALPDGGTAPRRAGVSSFGFGGANAHVVLEEAPPAASAAGLAHAQVFVLSAQTPEALCAAAERLARHLRAHPDLNPADVAYTLRVGREAWEHRMAVVADDLAGCAAELETFTGDSLVLAAPGCEALADLAERWVRGEQVECVTDEGARTGRRVHLPTYPFARTRHWVRPGPGGRGPAGEPAPLHPSLLDANVSTLSEVAFEKTLTGQECYLRDHVIGGRWMLPGAVQLEMARLAGSLADPGQGAPVVEDVVWAAPVQASGADGPLPLIRLVLHRDDDERVRFELRDASAGPIGSLRTSGRLCPTVPQRLPRVDPSRVDPSRVDLEQIASRCPRRSDGAECYRQFAELGFTYGPTFRLIDTLDEGDDEALALLRRPGAGVATGPIERTGPADEIFAAAVIDAAFQVAGRVVSQGGADAGTYLPYSVDRVWLDRPVPEVSYAHAVRRTASGAGGTLRCDISLCTADGAVFGRIEGFALRQSGPSPEPELLALEPSWVTKAATIEPIGADGSNGGTAILIGVPADQLLGERLGAAHLRVLRCEDPNSSPQARRMLADTLAQAAAQPGPLVVVQWATGLGDGSCPGVRAALDVAAGWAAGTGATLRWLYVIAAGLTDPADGAMTGFARSIAAEDPRLQMSVLTVPTGGVDLVDVAVGQEWQAASVPEVRYDQAGRRYLPVWRPVSLSRAAESPLARAGVHVVAGGTGALGFAVAQRIAERPECKVVLLARSDPSPSVAARIAMLTAGGAQIEHVRADLTDRAAVRAALAHARARFGALAGVVHAAGELRPGLLARKSREDFDAVLAAKVTGVRALDEETADDDLAYFTVFSSIASVLPGLGQVDYAYAAAYLDRYAVWREQLRAAGLRKGHTVSIAWPLWAEGGMRAAPEVREWASTELGLSAMPTQTALDAFESALTSDATRLVLAVADRGRLRRALDSSPTVSTSSGDGGAEDDRVPQADVERYLTGLVAEELGLPDDDVSPTEPLERYGLDSLMITSLTRALGARLGQLPTTLFFEHRTVRELAGALVMQHHGTRLVAGESRQDPARGSTSEHNTTGPVAVVAAGPDGGAETGPGLLPALHNDDPDEIVIIGMSGRYPQADDVREFWRNLRTGRDCVEEIPADRWNGSAFFDTEKGKLGHSYSRWGGFLRDADRFDPLFFRMSQIEAEHIDPQERVFLETVWHLLEDAGYSAEEMRGSRTGVFVGMMYGHYQLYGVQAALRGQGRATSSSYASVANRVSYFFDFTGPSVGLDTMCSSALVAIHQACLAIRNGDCETAVAGGVNITSHPIKYLQLADRGFLSSDGRCRSFGAGGDGYVPAEGSGALLLKRRQAAEADGDQILGVVAASAVNHGGSGTGYSVPNPIAQRELITEALRRAGLDAGDLDYLEAHGTGTSLGDPVEVAGLAQALTDGSRNGRPLPLGSVKSNIGHAESAAGVAAVTKVLLQLRHGELVPSLHADELNPGLDLATSGLTVQRELAPWPTPVDESGRPRPRIAGVSSFGAGGTNAHIVLREHVAGPRPAPRRRPGAERIAVVSAPTQPQLQAYARRLAEHLRGEGAGIDLESLVYTLQVGRSAMAHRLAVMADDVASIATALELAAAGTPAPGTWTGQSHPRRPGPVIELDDESSAGAPALAAAWVQGGRVDWRARYEVPPARVSLPGLPFAGERVWLPAADQELHALGVGPSGRRQVLLGKQWEPAPATTGTLPPRIAIMATAATAPLATAVAARLPGAEVVQLPARSPAGGTTGADSGYDAIVDLVGCAADERQPVEAWLPWLQAAVAERRDLTALLVTRGLEAPCESDPTLLGAERVGLYRMLGAEYRHVRSRHLDVAADTNDDALADAIRTELTDHGDEVEVRVDEGVRKGARLRPLPVEDAAATSSIFAGFPPEHVLWVAGGTRGIGLLTARYLVERHQVRRVVLAGSRPVPPREQWPALRAEAGAAGRLVRAIEELEAAGAQVRVLAVPLERTEEVAAAVRDVRASMGPVGGLIHSAGITDFDCPAFVHKPPELVRQVLAPKVDGTDNLLQCLREEPLRFAVLFSSVAAASPHLAVGQSDYAMANTYLDYVAQARPYGIPLVSIQWPSWKDTGMGAATTAAYLSTGLAHLSDVDGLRLLEAAAASGPRVVLPAMVSDVEPEWSPDRIVRPLPGPAATPEDGGASPASPSGQSGAPDPTEANPAADALAANVLDQLAAELRLPRERLDTITPLHDYGIDSILVTQLTQGVARRLEIELDPSALFENPTADGFAAWVAQRYPAELARAFGEAAASDGEQTSPVNPGVAAQSLSSSDGSIPPPRADDLAIIGMSCRFPGAPELGAYWRLLRDGRSAIAPVPPGRWGRPSAYSAALIEDWSSYDPEAFRLPIEDAVAMDPQALLLLELVLAAGNHAGYQARELKGRRIGVYVGARSHHEPTADALERARNPVVVTGQNYLAANVCQSFDLHGPCLVVDTACSSALVALDLARHAIRSGDAEAAFVAGVSLLTDDRGHLVFAQRGLLSPEPAFHAFDARANGLVLGEGGGVVLVKSYEQALADGDRVYAVVRGVAVNNDGRTAGPASVNVSAQQDVMRTALARSGLLPGDVTHLEANAAGTLVTDLLEFKALRAVYPEALESHRTIGSVKPNIGHPLAAEGIAGLVKLALMLQHRTRVPFLSGDQPTTHLDLASAGFGVVRTAAPWKEVPLVGALNCFADGGTNVHVVVTAAPPSTDHARQPLPSPTLRRRDLRPGSGDGSTAGEALFWEAYR